MYSFSQIDVQRQLHALNTPFLYSSSELNFVHMPSVYYFLFQAFPSNYTRIGKLGSDFNKS